MHSKPLALALALAATLGSQAAFATDVALVADGSWNVFDVDSAIAASGGNEWIDLTDGSKMALRFSGPVTIKVVDGGFAGDTFKVYDNGLLLGITSAAVDSYPDSKRFDFDDAWTAGYSHATFVLGPGNHVITGELSRFALDDTGNPIGATVGAIAAVPEPASYALLAAGLGLVGLAARRRIH